MALFPAGPWQPIQPIEEYVASPAAASPAACADEIPKIITSETSAVTNLDVFIIFPLDYFHKKPAGRT
jgi:hypothetical protein